MVEVKENDILPPQVSPPGKPYLSVPFVNLTKMRNVVSIVLGH